jgi:hypothetical protein
LLRSLLVPIDLSPLSDRVVRRAFSLTPVLVVRSPARGPCRHPALGLDLDHAAAPLLSALFRVIPPSLQRVEVRCDVLVVPPRRTTNR